MDRTSANIVSFMRYGTVIMYSTTKFYRYTLREKSRTNN